MGDTAATETTRETQFVRQAYTEFNPLTGLYFSKAFFQKAEEFVKRTEPGQYCMVAIDIEHFRLFNKIYGRAQGDKLLVEIADFLNAFRKEYTGVVGYMGGDNYGVVMTYDKELLRKLRKHIYSIVDKFVSTVGFMPAFGVYVIDDVNIPAATMYDRATVALANVLGNYITRTCEYSPKMEESVEEELKLLADIQAAMQKDEFIFFVQPQYNISNGKVVGGEALVRWKHGTKGMIPPGIFVPILEKNGFIASLDRIVWKKVCEWLKSWIERGFQPVPISINVSRIDIYSMDVPAYLLELVNTYDIPTKYLKVEITESAYAENQDKIVKTVEQLRNQGFLVMMDDFGSGYSSLNMLKSVSVDVLKIDMRFLDFDEKEEEKGIGILESVVNMARQMRMPIIVEGVETQKQEGFLKKMGCRYTQGYYYNKPLCVEDFEALILDETKLDLNGFWCLQTEALRVKEFFDANLFNDSMINNIMGAIAFYEVYGNQVEITRVNEQYYQLAGISTNTKLGFYKKFSNHVRDDDFQILFGLFVQAYENPLEGAQGQIHFVRIDGSVICVHMRIFFLRENGGHRFFYGSLTDMTDMLEREREEDKWSRDIEEITEQQKLEIEDAYSGLPCGYCIARVDLDENKKPLDYHIVYANEKARHMSGGTAYQLHDIILRNYGEDNAELLEKAYKAAYEGETQEHVVYTAIGCRYLQLTIYSYKKGYAACLLQDVTSHHIHQDAVNNILLSYREVYYVHLQDNYYRMIYPENNSLIERGNYEESVNRHFGMGKILPYDEEGIRRFLSLEHLRSALLKRNTVEYQYRRSINGIGKEWCLTTITVCERQKGIPQTALLTIRSIEAVMRENENYKHRHMARILGSMSDGFFVYQATDDEKILYANPKVLKIFGCETMEEFKEYCGDSFKGMVHPEDVERVEWEIAEQIKSSSKKMDYIQYRIIRKDGAVRWLDDCGHLVDSHSEKNGCLFYVFITDVTDTITEEQKARVFQMNGNYIKRMKGLNDV